jgi:hypothetical protein
MIDPDTPWNSELIRYLFVFAAAPIWIPFLKALWKELLRAMRADGGLYGATPSRRKREEIEREIAQEPDPVVHEPIAHRGRIGEKRSGASPGGNAGRPAQFPQRRPNAAPPEKGQRRGFR